MVNFSNYIWHTSSPTRGRVFSSFFTESIKTPYNLVEGYCFSKLHRWVAVSWTQFLLRTSCRGNSRYPKFEILRQNSRSGFMSSPFSFPNWSKKMKLNIKAGVDFPFNLRNTLLVKRDGKYRKLSGTDPKVFAWKPTVSFGDMFCSQRVLKQYLKLLHI